MSITCKIFNDVCFKWSVSLFFQTGKPTGYDRVRNAEIGNKNFDLDVLEEAYTTEHWLVRIYKVKDLDNRGA